MVAGSYGEALFGSRRSAPDDAPLGIPNLDHLNRPGVRKAVKQTFERPVDGINLVLRLRQLLGRRDSLIESLEDGAATAYRRNVPEPIYVHRLSRYVNKRPRAAKAPLRHARAPRRRERADPSSGTEEGARRGPEVDRSRGSERSGT
jgi:hypothetical protein